jgi:hypothetical protein
MLNLPIKKFKMPKIKPINSGYDIKTGEDRNKKVKQYRYFDDMYNIIEKDFYPEIIDQLNTDNNIIIITPNQYNFIKRNIFGKLDILASTDIDLSSCKSIDSGSGMNKVINYIPKIKIIVPKGVNVDFNSPYQNNYTNKIYTKIDIENRHNFKCEISDFLIYKKIFIDLYIDLHQMKRSSPLLKVKFGEPLFTISFSPIYYVGSSDDIDIIEEIYWIKNDELFNMCEDIF